MVNLKKKCSAVKILQTLPESKNDTLVQYCTISAYWLRLKQKKVFIIFKLKMATLREWASIS